MTKKIKYQGRTYILESSLDSAIKEKLELKINDTLDDVLGLDNGMDEHVTEETLDENVEGAPVEEPQVLQAIESIKQALAVGEISEENLVHLKMILSDILAEGGAGSVEGLPEEAPELAEAPDTILHEGRVFKKVGKASKAMLESIGKKKETPKTIKFEGKIFKRVK